MVDAFKLRAYFAAMPMVGYQLSKYSDDDVRKSLQKTGGNIFRQKLYKQMLEPYTPSFLLDNPAENENPIPGLDWRTAEGIMRAVEDEQLTDDQWRELFPAWRAVLATTQADFGERFSLAESQLHEEERPLN